jgi:hypothetical protein
MKAVLELRGTDPGTKSATPPVVVSVSVEPVAFVNVKPCNELVALTVKSLEELV